jgi:hypothetical protein
MAKILVVGGYLNIDHDAHDVADLGRCIGREVIRQGHVLISACLTEFDRDTAEGAAEELQAADVKSRIQTWIAKDAQRVHSIGTVFNSEVSDWDPAFGIDVPEPIDNADVLIFVRGYDGVNRAALWADSSQKPILPVASYGGASSKLYKRELGRLDRRYTGRITKDDFIILQELTENRQDFAKRVVSLAEDILSPRTVSVAMSFAIDGSVGTHLKNVYAAYVEVCKNFGYECSKVTELNATKGIIGQIKEEIRKAGFTLVDLTEVKPNVLFEFGFADGLGKDYLVTAREGTELPFDVQDIGTIFWKPDDIAGFKERLTEKFKIIAAKHGYLD